MLRLRPAFAAMAACFIVAPSMAAPTLSNGAISRLAGEWHGQWQFRWHGSSLFGGLLDPKEGAIRFVYVSRY